ncbi:MAG: hypothetical protein IKU15_08445 [Clostridia bacterium]|nr:hypothetical protein [Clostridia bacterium]
MGNFWDYSVWETFSILAILLGSLLVGNIIKKVVPFLKKSLIPTSVIGGVILIIISVIYKEITGTVMFDTYFFGGNGTEKLEIVTYHALALGFIASTLKNTENKMTKKRASEIFNTGVTTVSVYLLQGVVGLTITFIAARVVKGFFPVAGVLLPFGYGQGTGQALNYGSIYELQYGFVGGKSFGLTVAALGFLSASIGGVIHLNVMKYFGKLKLADKSVFSVSTNEDTPEQNTSSESLDRLTMQISLIILSYFVTYGLMFLLGNLLPGMKSVIYGFNFLLGVIVAILVKSMLKFLTKKSVLKRRLTDDFLLTRISNLCFDVMIVSGIAAIRLDSLENYWGIIIILGVVGAVMTYAYNRFVAKKLFPEYSEEQFLMMYGMLTGTASTGTILLREVDSDFKTPASDNMIYQNLPAIAFGFPMMILATIAPEKPTLAMIIFVAYFIVMNIILFREQIFKKLKK